MKPTRRQGRARRSLSRVRAMAQKEVAHILRDRQVLLFAIGMPLLLLLLFGYAVSFDIENIPLVVVDQDRSPASRRLVEAFASGDVFEIVARRDRPDEVETLFRSAAAKTALVIPEGYERAGKRGETAKAQILLDGSDGTTASIALGYAQALALRSSQQELSSLLDFLGAQVEAPVEARVRTLFNPALHSAVFLVPGLMVVILALVAVMLTSLTIAREYERGSMEQLFATPVSRLEVILGKLGPFFVIGLVQVLLVLTLGVSLFGVPLNGSLLLVYALASLFLLAMLTQGLFISVITRNQMVASQAAAISTFLPALLLSGFIFPVENMPALLQLLASLLPPRYFVDGLRAVMLRGNGLEVIGPDMLAIAAFFLVLLGVSVKRFQRTVA